MPRRNKNQQWTSALSPNFRNAVAAANRKIQVRQQDSMTDLSTTESPAKETR